MTQIVALAKTLTLDQLKIMVMPSTVIKSPLIVMLESSKRVAKGNGYFSCHMEDLDTVQIRRKRKRKKGRKESGGREGGRKKGNQTTTKTNKTWSIALSKDFLRIFVFAKFS